MHQFSIDPKGKVSIVKQIANSIISEIEKGLLTKDDRLMSITDFAKRYRVARVTVEKAYKTLQDCGYIIAVPGKGNFVTEVPAKGLKVLMILNKISSYKKDVYEAFIRTLGEDAKVDLQIHLYNPHRLKEILDSAKGKYHYYVVMPHFSHEFVPHECNNVLNSIPAHELVLLDKKIDLFDNSYMCIYQDFRADIYEVLSAEASLLSKYHTLNVIIPGYRTYPSEIKEGISAFCAEHNKAFNLYDDVDRVEIRKAEVYISLTENELAALIKNVRASGFKVGEEVGILSFNETVLKDLLGISVVSTDFVAMGQLAAEMILKKDIRQLRNKFLLIKRESL